MLKVAEVTPAGRVEISGWPRAIAIISAMLGVMTRATMLPVIVPPWPNPIITSAPAKAMSLAIMASLWGRFFSVALARPAVTNGTTAQMMATWATEVSRRKPGSHSRPVPEITA